MEEFINIFIDEAEGLLANLESDLLKLEKESDNKKIIDNIFRVMHTLKGSAGMYGFENIQNLTHEFENIYDLIRDNKASLSPVIIDKTFEAVDILKKMLRKNDDDKRTLELLNTLKSEFKNVLNEGNEPTLNIREQSSKSNIFGILFTPDEDIFERGINPENILKELQESGISEIVLHENGIPIKKQIKNKSCKALWEIYLITDLSRLDIENVFMFMDLNEYHVIEIHNGKVDLDEESEFIKNILPYYSDIEDFRVSANSIITKISSTDNNNLIHEKPTIIEDISIENNNTTEKISNKIIESSIKVSSNKIDELLNLVSELVTSTAGLQSHAERIRDPQLLETFENIEKITKKFRINALDLRLVPLSTLTNKFKRQVRDLAKDLNREVELIFEDHDTEIDKSILKAIETPLLHIIRNSIDHGIETPEERIKLDKNPVGLLKISSFYSGANIIIQIQDDGRGINLDRVRECALVKGYIEKNQTVTDQDLIALIMEPGFTTKENVSMVSGRGVGMDVVKKELNEVKGSLEIETEKGLGTYITLKLPTTLSIIDTLMVEVNKTNYLLPLLEVEYCFNEKTENILKQENNCLQYKNDFIPFISLREKFNCQQFNEEESMVIIINKLGKKYALIVDYIIGEQQAVIKNMGDLFINQPYFSGGNILADGKISLIIDTNYLLNLVTS